jgi:tetratricopeptide (TPR) repeat protein
LTAVSFGQKNNKRDKYSRTQTAEISSEVRKQSYIFAEGLKDFYSGNFTNAEQLFREVIAQNPKNDAAYFMLSRVKSATGDYSGAAYYLDLARKIDKNNVWYVVESATIYDHSENFKQSAKLWEEVCKIIPDNEYYLVALSEAYLAQQQYVEVIKVYNRIEKSFGLNEELSNAKKSIYLEMNDVKGAVGEYDKLIKSYPYEIKYYVEAANIYLVNDMVDRAESYYRQAQLMDKNNPYLQFSLANYYQIIKKEDDAYKSLLQAFKSPELPLDLLLPAFVPYYSQIKDDNDKLLKKALHLADAISTSHPNADAVWVIYSILQNKNHDFNDARNSLEKALAINNADYRTWEYYINTLIQLKEYQIIVNNAEEMLELFPSNAVMNYYIGLSFLHLKEPSQALNYLNQASMYAYDPALLASVYDSMGDANLDLNNKQEAIKCWNTALKKGADRKYIKEKIAKAEK